MSQHSYYGHGKLLLTGEYFVLDGALSLALPTKLGQRMNVKYRPSNDPKLYWKSFDHESNCWLEAVFELWHFDIISANDDKAVKTLKDILVQARKQNIHFLRDGLDIYVETQIEFPLYWGLGSSSSLIYNIAQWAYISPYELLANTFKGSGYDIACAQSLGPITYKLTEKGPQWETVNFDPLFKSNIYFVYLNKKQSSREGIALFESIDKDKRQSSIKSLSDISKKILKCIDLKEFEDLLLEHEQIVSSTLGIEKVQSKYFSDFWGVVKSLGAWGGDFALVTSNKSFEETKEYFSKKGYKTIVSFDELIVQKFKNLHRPSHVNVEEALYEQ